MPAPQSTLTEVAPAGGFSAIRPRGIPVFLGCSSKGPTTPQTFGPRRMADIAETYGAGPMSREAAYIASQTSGPCLCIRVPATARAASHTAAVVTKGNASDFTSTLSGAATRGADVVIRFVVGGTTATGPIDYKLSVDGGATYGATVHLGTATTITVYGVTIDLGSAKVVTTNDEVAWFQRAASAAILPTTATRAKASTTPSTASFTPSGTPVDAYRARVEILTAGTIGTAGITYRYALDWDGVSGTWSKEQHLNTGTTISPDDGAEPTGLTWTFGAGTLDAGDIFEHDTTAPEPQWADILAALTALRAAKLTWSFLAICAPMSATDAGALDTLLTGWAAAGRRAWAVIETRDREASETLTAWRSRILADFVAFASTRVAPAAGHAPMACAITGRRNRRSALIDYVSRFVQAPKISTDVAQVTLGPLPASRTLYDASGAQVEHDADRDPSLFDRGFLVLRTWEDEQLPGTYPCGSVFLSPAGDLGLVPLRRILDAFQDALQSQARLELASSFRRFSQAQAATSGGKYKKGDIFEADALGIERRLRVAARRAVVDTGDASDVKVTLDRTPIALGGGKFRLKYSAQCSGPGYVYEMSGEAGLEDPDASA